jgi:hypothetical protein
LIFNRLGYIHLAEAYKETETEVSDPTKNQISHMNQRKTANVTDALIAKEMYLKACKIAPTSQSWLGAGRACFALEKYEEAEDAFAVLFCNARKRTF